MPDNPTLTEPDAERAFVKLVAANSRLADAQQKARLERERLDALIADTVSTNPTSEVWYAHPGILTIDAVTGAVGGGPTGVHRAMERFRKVQSDKAASRNSRAARRRRAASR